MEYLYHQTGKVLEDFKKTIETLETVADDSKTADPGEEEEVLQDTSSQMDDLTVSTVGVLLKESSDIAQLETPVQPVRETAVKLCRHCQAQS